MHHCFGGLSEKTPDYFLWATDEDNNVCRARRKTWASIKCPLRAPNFAEIFLLRSLKGDSGVS